MRIPQQVSDRVKEAPAQALRAVFAGIGQVLLVADRMKSRAAEANRARPDTAAPPARPAPSPAPGPNGAASAPDKTAPDKTAPDKTAPDKTAPDVAKPAAAKPAPAKPAAAKPAAAKPAPAKPAAAKKPAPAEPAAAKPTPVKPAAAKKPAPAKPAPAKPAPAKPTPAKQPTPAEPAPAVEPAAAAASVLPVPNYDGLAVASLRARLRNLDSPQLRVLIDYEKAHAGRTDVVAMFERRIAKLESGEA